MQPKFLQLLQQRREKGSERSLLSFTFGAASSGDGVTDFCSNDYLGLAQQTVDLSLKGSTGSRLITGNSAVVEEVENYLANHFGSEAALVFNSGYDANLGFFSSVPQKGDTILYDELIHASVRDGVRLSFAKSHAFRHNDLSDLKEKLSRAEGAVFVAVESLYSMDGDLSPLKAIADVCQKKDAFLVVDEAHAGGVYGPEGKGLTVEADIHCFARLYTFGKAFGAHGAVICCSTDVRRYLINFARSFIYTTAMPEAFYRHLQAQVERSKDDELRRQLQNNIAFFRRKIPCDASAPDSPIQAIPFSTVEACKEAADRLQKNGLAVKAILPPTVPEGGQRLRICLHAFNTQEELEQLAELLLSELS